jgi:hypothetical protein
VDSNILWCATILLINSHSHFKQTSRQSPFFSLLINFNSIKQMLGDCTTRTARVKKANYNFRRQTLAVNVLVFSRFYTAKTVLYPNLSDLF